MFARLSAAMRTTAARLTALYLLLFAACATVLVIYMTSLSTKMMVEQIEASITDEMQGIGRAYQRGGIQSLVRVVTQRARQPGANLYLITDAQRRILSGNVQSLQPGVLDQSGWTREPFLYQRYGDSPIERNNEPNGKIGSEAQTEADPDEPVHKAIAMVLGLPNGMIILVGRDLGEPERFGFVVQRALMVTLAIMGLGACLIWYFVGRTALRRIDRLSSASRRIMEGDMAQRLPVDGSGDEFDRLSENLNQMLTRIESLNEGLKQVSDNIAHDLRTPLTRLRNRAEAALGRDRSEDDYRQALEANIDESDQLIRTFNAILMISRLEAGSSADALEQIDLSAILRDVVELYEPSAEEANVRLELGELQEISISGNRELISQAISNILDNALKYSSEAIDPQVRLSLTSEQDRALVVISDNGPGIAKEDRARATERFVRLEASRSQPGSGLGLSLAQAVMRFHGGTLELDDAEPGLRVTMEFPLQKGTLAHA